MCCNSECSEEDAVLGTKSCVAQVIQDAIARVSFLEAAAQSSICLVSVQGFQESLSRLFTAQGRPAEGEVEMKA